jgi:uncharacterized membrane protein YhaH (DUF805 family)
MTFREAVATCFRKYADFGGRASRSEYWWFSLLQALVAWPTFGGMGFSSSRVTLKLAWACLPACALPSGCPAGQ